VFIDRLLATLVHLRHGGTETAGAVITPRLARRKNQIAIFPAVAAAHEAECRAHASKQIRVEHGISHLKNWRALSRHIGRREHLDTILRAVAGLVFSQEPAHDLNRSTAHRRLHRPAAPRDRTGFGQVENGPPPTMHEVVRHLCLILLPNSSAAEFGSKETAGWECPP